MDAKRARKIVTAIKKEIMDSPRLRYDGDSTVHGCDIALKPFFKGGQSPRLYWMTACNELLSQALATLPVTVSLGNDKEIMKDLTTEIISQFDHPDDLDLLQVQLRCQYGRVLDALLDECYLDQLLSPTARRRIKGSVTWPKKRARRDRRMTGGWL